MVRVLNYFEMNKTAYLVMDYLEGEDLTTYLKQQPNGRLPWRQAIRLMLPVLDGLQEVHEAGFMHRDLKPGNLYWTDDGLVLLDFGSARQVNSTHSHSLLIYSAGYAPYEQYLEGNLTRQGPWTDVYGAAATLYFMLTAQRPPSALERKQSGLLRQPDLLKPIRHWIPDVPETLDAALLRALAVEPEQRLQSMAEFKQQLERVLAEEEPTRPKPPTTPTVASKPPPKLKAASGPPVKQPRPGVPLDDLGGDALKLVDKAADYVETKLDLAAAYLEMGDQVGARSLLDEVLREGDATQKKRARAFLNKLGGKGTERLSPIQRKSSSEPPVKPTRSEVLP